jgi:diguanylate cyclase (GGDEF)-like protein/PAS domain S-box-containing protein
MAIYTKDWLRLYLALFAFVMGVAGLTTYSLWLLRSDAIRHGLQVSALMARSFENFLTQSLSATELAAVSVVRRDRIGRDGAGVATELNQLLHQAPHLRSLSVIDAQDRIVVSSNPENVGLRVSTQEYLPLLQGGASALRIGKPWLGRDFDERQSPGSSSLIPVVLPLGEDGTDLRLLVALNPDFFVNHMAQQLDAQTGIAEVLRLDGVHLMSTDQSVDGQFRHFGDTVLHKMGEQEFGQIEDMTADGQAMLSAFRVSSIYPFVVVSHLHRETALEQWQTELRAIVGIVVPSAILVVIFASGYYRRQRLLKEQQVESARLERINAACVFDNSREGIIIASADGVMTDVNAAFTRITGYEREDVIGKNPSMLSSGRHDKAFYKAMWQSLTEKGHWSGELWNRRKDGEVFAEILTISAVTGSQGTVQQYVAVFTNITAIKTYQTELERIARFDALTDLPNRVLLADRLHQSMSQAIRRENMLAVAFIDLDGFKGVNDTHGHEAGDHVLTTIAARMREVLREGDTLARNGGDEFVALLVDLATTSDAQPMLTRLLDAASQCIEFHGMQLRVSASIGVSFYPQAQVTSMEVLLRQADAAMYQAKLAGKNRCVFFNPNQPDPEPRADHLGTVS